ncbi:MAG TPA: hypothetical protein DEV87_07565 [Clostridiales bacterium]|nr:hypothetical protein [Clostridiales bacterium]
MSGKEIIERIGYFRTKAGLTQRALSIDIDMNVGYINRLECKKDFLPSIEVLTRIIEACGVTEEEFFYDDVRNYEEDKSILKKIKGLSQEKRSALLTLL